MAVTLNLEPEGIDPEPMPATSCEIALYRRVTSEGLPAVVLTVPSQPGLLLMLTLREFLAAGRGLRARAELWPEWQEADTP